MRHSHIDTCNDTNIVWLSMWLLNHCKSSNQQFQKRAVLALKSFLLVTSALQLTCKWPLLNKVFLSIMQWKTENQWAWVITHEIKIDYTLSPINKGTKNPPVLWLPKTLTVNLNILVHSMVKAIAAVANVALTVSMPQIDNDTVLLNL